MSAKADLAVRVFILSVNAYAPIALLRSEIGPNEALISGVLHCGFLDKLQREASSRP